MLRILCFLATFLTLSAGLSAAEVGTTVSDENVAAAVANRFGVDGPFLIAQIINFCIVGFLLWRFAFKPVLATINEREKKISDGLQYAEEMKGKLSEAEQTRQTTIREANAEAQTIVESARKNAETYESQQRQEAHTVAEGIVTKARQAGESEKKRILAEARDEVARLVVTLTGRVLNRELSADEKARFNQEAARDVTANKAG
jgi:F-type H+-transporting ATPase subunit b